MKLGEFSLWMKFVLAVLATWRITNLLVNEDGPAGLLVRFRALWGDGMIGRLLDCFHCMSLWVAAPLTFYIGKKPLDLLFTWLALPGAACLLERLAQDPVVLQPAPQTDFQERGMERWDVADK